MTAIVEQKSSQPFVSPAGTLKEKRTILIYSPDLNLSFSLSSFFQDRFKVVTTTDPELLEVVALNRHIDLVMIDAEPSGRLIERLQELRRSTGHLPVLMLYVYGPRGGEMDKAVRHYVDAILYKPFDVRDVSRRIEELLGN